MTESAFRRLEVALSSLGINIVRSTNRLGRQAIPCSAFSGRFRGCLHGGTQAFSSVYMGDHYSLRGETLVFLVIYMGGSSWVVLERS